MKGLMNFMERHITPIAMQIGGNNYLKAISSGFVAVMSVTIIGSLFTLITNLPIKEWTTYLTESGLGTILSLPSQFTVDMIALYVVFFVGYNLAKEFKVDGKGAGLACLVSFLLITGKSSFFATATTDATSVSAIATTYLGARGLFAAMIVGLVGGRIYVEAVKRGWVIKLPDSVPPNVASSFSALIPASIVTSLFLLVAGIMKQTSYGDFHTMIFQIIQANLIRFMGNNIFSWIFFNLMTSLLWFFGLHGGNIVGSITNPVYIPLSLENFAAYTAKITKMPYIFIGMPFTKTFTSGGVASMFGLAILMTFFAKSKQFKILGKLSLPTTLFFINEPLLFGIPIVLNPLYFIPLMFTTAILGTLTYFVMSIGLVPIPIGAQLPWTTPPILHGFLQGGVVLALWEALMILGAMAIWYPFFKLGDKKAIEEENKQFI